MIKITVNNLEFLVKSDISILEACKYLGITIPRFCYHEMLSVVGNCRMCLVEVDEAEKPVASCVTLVKEGMIINTENAFVKKARENVVEALLLNHPLDCPICDQAGECDLQDQTISFGSDHSRFFFNKRGVEDKNCGSLIKTIMTRCIHCTRCIRFASEVAGVDFLGTFNRGGSTEIGNYISGIFKSEISGNVIDLCPVGALTSKPYAFKVRPWELRVGESIDLTDGLGSPIYVHFKETQIARITPRSNKYLNNNIISDKARFSYDSSRLNRIDKLYEKKDGLFSEKSWIYFFTYLDNFFKEKNAHVNVYFDEELDFLTLNYLSRLNQVYKNKIRTISSAKSLGDQNFVDSSNFGQVSEIDSIVGSCFIISCNLAVECAVLNSRLRMKLKNTSVICDSIGFYTSSNISTRFIHLSLKKGLRLFQGTSFNSTILSLSKHPAFIIGQSIKYRTACDTFLDILIKKLSLSKNILHILVKSNSCGLQYTKLNTNKPFSSGVDMILNVSDSFYLRKSLLNKKKTIVFGSNGNKIALKSNFIVPVASKFESTEIHINLEGRAQQTEKFFKSQSAAREMKTVLNAIFNLINKPSHQLNFVLESLYDSSLFIKKESKLFNELLVKSNFSANRIKKYPLKILVDDFHSQGIQGENSLIMQKCSVENERFSTNFN